MEVSVLAPLLAVGVLLALTALGVSVYGASQQRNAERVLLDRQSRADEVNATLLKKFNGTVHELSQVRDLLAVSVAEQGRLRPALDAALTEIVRLRAALDAANSEIAQLRNTINAKVANARSSNSLLLIQCEPAFGETDAQAIRRAGLPFQRRAKCTLESFDEALQTSREDNANALWLQISAHMNAKQIKFYDQEASVEWLSQRIRGIEILYLAGCENEEIGKQLVGTNLAQNVITMLEPVESRDAGNFTFAFWRSMVDGNSVLDAYEQARRICPQVSEFVQLRSAKRR